MPGLDITVSQEGIGPSLVCVAGEIDLATTPQLRESLTGLEGDIVVDISGVSFLDSTALGALVGAATRTRDAGSSFSLRGESEFVARLLKVAGLDSFFSEDGEREG